MPSLNVRNLPVETHHALRVRAAEHGRSVEAEVRAIIDDAVMPKTRVLLGTLLREIGIAYGDLDLDIKRDQTPTDPASFD